MALHVNNLFKATASNQLCKAFGIKVSPHTHIVQLAKNAGFESLFIDLEHAWLSLDQTTSLCHVGLLAGISPFVRVPHKCGNGFVQRVLDGGAMGVIFPHIHSAEDAKAAVSICKYPPQGCRSMTGQLPQFGLQGIPVQETIRQANQSASTVFAMIESHDAVERAGEIAAVEGVDVILVGSLDLSIELGIPGQFNSEQYRTALETVSKACRTHGKIFGLAGIYDDPVIQDWAINELGVRFMLVQQDTSLISGGGKRAAAAVPLVRT
ncbi:hypothetical protein N7489_008110 [Penicillium chrysogenum]|uniref:HpcH/HpaI aldolase/citrate lyase domain-containing protein n=1 Tax=Penicillium chrysogenum TaxID=5076 RepID=A0ABQ8WAA3_PENCH|nr:uncharacterized protein N7489_008110 [Penicillium chrysogenum]KAJ5238019.1 hypothetical protein N7489_008110 [Penicillium chrysogenum]KAJ5261725.1 hypothetical protein N7505_008592 [Penicillium chrysogenum]KAJ5278322.1 hypothetical protein N7524_004475 [Penicillium chrysogenum]KAJ6159652.1 hypothetical protein N7497_004189 [Penicillium chrysogenum]